MNEQSMENLQKAIDGILHPWGWKLEAKKGKDEVIVVEYNMENLNKTLFSGAVFRLVLYEFEIRHFSLLTVKTKGQSLFLVFDEQRKNSGGIAAETKNPTGRGALN
jgi:hypothetical protein